MKKLLAKWCVEVSIFTITVLTFQVLGETIASVNIAAAALLGLAATAALLAAGLWLAGDDDATGGRKTAIRAGIGARRRNAARIRTRK